MTDERRSQGGRKPVWLRIGTSSPRRYRATSALLGELGLSTVCRTARCPNKSECFSAGTASFLILGEVCTRRCRFCAIGSAAGVRPGPARPATLSDADEPRRVAEAVRRLRLRHVVVTSVTRDDLSDGGAGHFARTIEAVRDATPQASVEVLIPDFGGDRAALGIVLGAGPDVIAHNLETVARLSPTVRPQADHGRSLAVLRAASAAVRSHKHPGATRRTVVKTGLMVGLGESDDDVRAALEECGAAGVDAVTIGQYLRPNERCLPVARFVHPEVFDAYRRYGEEHGLMVQSGPFVRSSYHAAELLAGSRTDTVEGDFSRQCPPA